MAMSGAASLQLSEAFSKCSISKSSRAQAVSASQASSSRSSTSFSAPAVVSRSLLWGVRPRRSVVSSSPSAASARRAMVMATFMSDDYEETEEEIKAGYEALYGKAFGQGAPEKKWEAVEDKDGEGEEAGARTRRTRPGEADKFTGRREDRGGRGARGDFEERVVQIRRVTKVVKGGKQLSFRAVVVVGDKKGRVGVGVNKAKEVIIAVQKAVVNAKRNMVTVPLNKYKTFPHRADGHYGAAHVMLRPASIGTGVIAGGSVRIVLELAGVENALGKQIGSENPLNNARAVLAAVTSMKTFRQVSEDRGIPMEELWK